MKLLDLFSGIGGFSLAASWAGIETVAFCEIDPFCQKVLRKYWPHVPIYSDIRDLRGSEIGTVDIISGGFPCQPFSVAGKRRGKEDDRYLWPEMFRVIKEIKPRWVVAENVAGIVRMALDDVLSDLESEGYEAGTFIIPACAVGAPHRRDRVWIVAYSTGINDRRRSGEIQSTDEQQETKRQEKRFSKPSGAGQDVADTSSERLEREINQTRQIARCSRKQCKNRQIKSRLGGVSDGFSGWLDSHRWPAPFGCEQYDWEPPRLAKGLPYRVQQQRLRALGNAIVPQVAFLIFNAIVTIENELRCRE